MNPRKTNWVRRGLLVAPGAGIPGFTHASHPCILSLEGDNFLVIYSMRDSLKRSHIFVQLCLIERDKIVITGQPKRVLSPGRMGTFDCEGLLACCPVQLESGETYFYYSGWNNLLNGLWLCDTGLALIDKRKLEFTRLSEGPVMGRDRHNPFFAAATAVIQKDGVFRAWYNSGIDWTLQADHSFKPKYGIHYAESHNGLDWRFSNTLVIPFSDSSEHSFGRPTVVLWDDFYQMWFSCRGADGDPEYKIGYAYSKDGITWRRADDLSGFQTSENKADFDGIAQAYPYAFQHEGIRFLLYCGNSYGATGFGYAVHEYD